MSIYHVCPYIIICMNFLLGEDEYGIGKVSGEWLHFLLWCQHTDLGAVYCTSSSSSTYSLGTTEVNIHCPTMNTCFPYIAVLCAPQATIAYSYWVIGRPFMDQCMIGGRWVGPGMRQTNLGLINPIDCLR